MFFNPDFNLDFQIIPLKRNSIFQLRFKLRINFPTMLKQIINSIRNSTKIYPPSQNTKKQCNNNLHSQLHAAIKQQIIHPIHRNQNFSLTFWTNLIQKIIRTITIIYPTSSNSFNQNLFSSLTLRKPRSLFDSKIKRKQAQCSKTRRSPPSSSVHERHNVGCRFRRAEVTRIDRRRLVQTIERRERV